MDGGEYLYVHPQGVVKTVTERAQQAGQRKEAAQFRFRDTGRSGEFVWVYLDL